MIFKYRTHCYATTFTVALLLAGFSSLSTRPTIAQPTPASPIGATLNWDHYYEWTEAPKAKGYVLTLVRPRTLNCKLPGGKQAFASTGGVREYGIKVGDPNLSCKSGQCRWKVPGKAVVYPERLPKGDCKNAACGSGSPLYYYWMVRTDNGVSGAWVGFTLAK